MSLILVSKLVTEFIQEQNFSNTYYSHFLNNFHSVIKGFYLIFRTKRPDKIIINIQNRTPTTTKVNKNLNAW